MTALLQCLSIYCLPQAELLLLALRSCAARCTPTAPAAPAFAALNVRQTRVLQSIVTAVRNGFGPLQQSLAALPVAKKGVLGISTAICLLPCAYLAPVTQTASLPSQHPRAIPCSHGACCPSCQECLLHTSPRIRCSTIGRS